MRLPVQIDAPVGGATPAIGSTVGFGRSAGGVATGTDFTWSEVGIMRAVPGVGDDDYLTAGDVTAAERAHRPIHSEPVRRCARTRRCFARFARRGGFTYQGQPFDYTAAPVITATAVSVSGTTTTNYPGAFFKLSNTTLSGRTYSSPAAGSIRRVCRPPRSTPPLRTQAAASRR